MWVANSVLLNVLFLPEQPTEGLLLNFSMWMPTKESSQHVHALDVLNFQPWLHPESSAYGLQREIYNLNLASRRFSAAWHSAVFKLSLVNLWSVQKPSWSYSFATHCVLMVDMPGFLLWSASWSRVSRPSSHYFGNVIQSLCHNMACRAILFIFPWDLSIEDRKLEPHWHFLAMSIHVLVTFLRAHLGGRRATYLQIGDMLVNASELPYSELDCSLGKGLEVTASLRLLTGGEECDWFEGLVKMFVLSTCLLTISVQGEFLVTWWSDATSFMCCSLCTWPEANRFCSLDCLFSFPIHVNLHCWLYHMIFHVLILSFVY